MSKFYIGTGLSLPPPAVTETFGLLGKRGSGKTNLLRVMAEEMLGSHHQVICFDPTGASWGLRYGADGKSPGMSILICGGEHADLPLLPTAGAVLAEFAVEERQSMVLDLSYFSKGEMRRFVTDFAETLYQKKAPEAKKTPVHLFFDEADIFVPQRIEHGAERCFGAVDTLMRRGRIRGCGVTVASQRPAVINKDVLSQIEVLVALRMTAPQDRDAIEHWVESHADRKQAAKLLEDLPSLPQGTAWVWSPGFLDIFKKVPVRLASTFDSSATPVAGKRLITPKNPAQIDKKALEQKMAATFEEARKSDPREMRKLVEELRRENTELKNAKAPKEPKEVIKKVAVALLTDKDHENLRKAQDRLVDAVKGIEGTVGQLQSIIMKRTPAVEAPVALPAKTFFLGAGEQVTKAQVRRERALVNGKANGDLKLGKAERVILQVLLQHPEGRNKNQVGIIGGYRPGGGSFNNALGALRTAGLIAGGNEHMLITASGRSAVGPVEPLPKGRAQLLEHWGQKLGKAGRMILEATTDAYPKGLTKEEVAEKCGYEPGGGSFNNMLGTLRTLELIHGYKEIKAADIFFE